MLCCLHLPRIQGKLTSCHCKYSGNFTRNCNPCYLINTDEGGQAAAQLMCSCSPEGSGFKIEYSLDLSKAEDLDLSSLVFTIDY